MPDLSKVITKVDDKWSLIQNKGKRTLLTMEDGESFVKFEERAALYKKRSPDRKANNGIS